MQFQFPALLTQANPPVAPTLSKEHGVDTPLWWVYRLHAQLFREVCGYVDKLADGVLVWRVGMSKLQRYYDGLFDLPWVADAELRAEYAALIERAKSNFMRTVIDSAVERVHVLGMRLPGDNEVADSTTWGIWQRNDLDHWSPIGVQTAMTQRRSMWSVWWEPGQRNQAKICLEDPQQTIVEYDPSDRRKRAAGLKLWVDDWTGQLKANLFLPEAIHRFAWMTEGGPAGWYYRTDGREKPFEKNPLGVVPLVPLVHKPQMTPRGVSRIEDVIWVQDRVNQTLANEGIAEHLTAFVQKWATGMEIPTDPETGEPIQAYKAAIDSLWIAEDDKAKFGQFDVGDLSGYWRSIEGHLEHISVISRTPRHAFMHQGQAPSGDAMKSDEAGLIADVKGFCRMSHQPAMREVLALARRIEGHETPLEAELVYADPEWQTFAQTVDGATKLVEKKIASLDWAREKVGMTPATIKRVKAEILQDALLESVLTPEPEVNDAAPAAERPG